MTAEVATSETRPVEAETRRAFNSDRWLGLAFVAPIVVAQFVSQLWGAVAIIGLATAAHQAWSANLMTLPSDLFPRVAVGSVVGIGGMAGAVGGMLMSKYNGYILDAFGSYQPIFALAGGAYIVAIAVMHSLSPRLTRVSEAAVS